MQKVRFHTTPAGASHLRQLPIQRKSALLPFLNRISIYVIFAWGFAYPSVHFYLGRVDVISGSYGISPAGLIDFGMFIFGAAVFGYCLLKGRIAAPFLFFPVLFYLFASLASVFLSQNPLVGIRGVVVNAVPYLFFLDLVMLSREKNLSGLCGRVAIFSAVIPMTIASLQILSAWIPPLRQVMLMLPADEYSLQPYPGLGIPRATGTFFSYNPFAVFLAIIFWGIFLELQGKWQAHVKWFFLVTSGLLLVSTFTRAVWFAMVASAGLVISLAKSRVRLVLIIIALVGGVVIFVSPLAAIISTRFADATSLEQRSDLAAYGWELFLAQPWGYGAGSSQLLTARLAWVPTVSLRGDLVGGYAFHNEYLTAGVEGGVLLLGATIFLLASLFFLGWRVYRLARWNPNSRKWGIWLMAATLILAQLGLTDSGLTYASFAFWILVAGVEMEYRATRIIVRTNWKRADEQIIGQKAQS